MPDVSNIYSDSSFANNFIRRYQKGSQLMYDGGITPLMTLLDKSFDLSGDDFRKLAELSMGWGVGSGSIPASGTKQTEQIVIDEKDVYGRAKIQRKAIYKARNGGAFLDALGDSVESTVRSFNWNVERQIMNYNANGSIGTIDTGGVSGSDPYVLTLTSATFNEAFVEVGIRVNIGNDPGLWKVTALSVANSTITVASVASTYTPQDGDLIYMQGSKDNDIESLHGVASATSSTKYGISIQHRWQATQINAASAPLTNELLDEGATKMFDYVGVGPTHWICHSTQWRKLAAQYEDRKYVEIMPRQKELRGLLSFRGLDYVGPTGDAPIITSRFCKRDVIYGININKMMLMHLQGGGWFNDDVMGQGPWLREAESDSYEARYGYYMQGFYPPPFLIYIHTLAT